MDAEDLELFRASLRQATASVTGEALDRELDELGWRDALAVDRRAAVSTLFELQGRANVTSSALDAVLASVLGVDAAVVLPRLGSCDPPAEVIGESVAVTGLATAALPRDQQAVAVAKDVVLLIGTDELTLRPVDGLDPTLGLVAVSGDGLRATSESKSAAWPVAVAAGQVALAHEIAGASRTMLQLARDHAVARMQFGRPIAAFQAVRHRLADSLVAIEAADAAIGGAWDDGSSFTAAMAKAVAGRSARTVARHCQQVLAGIGFTTEHPFHHYLRRVLVLDGLLGDARTLTTQLGQDLLGRRDLPAPLPL
ncbi:MAG TPA: acyl-CoA dehydrogenase family protein [Acidimicrobiales bacterium]|nr:acyl-CoA dehydrogenase family protein [Acidimicrobiales bacterium]